MDIDKENFEIKLKHELSFACIFIFVFAPFINMFIKHNNFELTEDDIDFINSYKIFWTVLTWIAIIAVITWIIYIYYWLWLFLIVSNILWFILLIWIFYWIFLIFLDKRFTLINFKETKKIKAWNINIINSYVPIFNISIRYNYDEQRKKNRRLKESYLFRMTLWFLWVIFFDTNFIAFLLIIIFLRVVFLFSWIDFINDRLKERIYNSFSNNYEELFWYIKWYIKNLTNSVLWLSKNINDSVQEYSQLHNLRNKLALFENLVLIILIWLYIYYYSHSIINSIYNILNLIPFIILLSKYIIQIYLRRINYIPIIHEILVLIKKIIRL